MLLLLYLVLLFIFIFIFIFSLSNSLKLLMFFSWYPAHFMLIVLTALIHIIHSLSLSFLSLFRIILHWSRWGTSSFAKYCFALGQMPH